MTEAASVYPSLVDRPIKNTVVLFDVDETLTPARRVRFYQIKYTAQEIANRCPFSMPQQRCLSFSPVCVTSVPLVLCVSQINLLSPFLTCVIQVGGSNLVKQQEQLGSPNIDVTTMFDFCFSENGLTAFRLGESLASNNFIQWLGEDKYQALVDFVLKFIANTKLPRKRGTFVEFRNGMVNISPVGRAASIEERDEFEAYVLMLELDCSFPRKSRVC
jgi:phosphomannomutase